jgi:hypothetical protein
MKVEMGSQLSQLGLKLKTKLNFPDITANTDYKEVIMNRATLPQKYYHPPGKGGCKI